MICQELFMSKEKILTEYTKKTITLEELSSLLKLGRSYTMELYEPLTDLVRSGSLKPVYNSEQNGNRKYPLYKNTVSLLATTSIRKSPNK